MILTTVLAPRITEIESYRIVKIDLSNPSEAKVTIHKSFKDSRIVPFDVTLELRRVGNQWHVVGDINYQENNAVSMKLPFTGSF